MLWAGAPRPGAVFSKVDLLQIPIEIVSLGLIIWFFSSIWTNEGEGLFSSWLVAMPFFLIVFYNLFGKYVFMYWRNRRTVYAVTDRKVVVSTSLPFRTELRTLEIADLPATRMDLKSDGRGSITFEDKRTRRDWFAAIRRSFSRNAKDNPIAFLDIANVRRVHDLILYQKNEMSRSRAKLVKR